MTNYYARVWIRNDAVYCMHTDVNAITADVFTGGSDEIIDIEVQGSYEHADVLMPLLTYSPTGLICTQRLITIMNNRIGMPYDIEAELQVMRERLKLSFAQLLIGLVTEAWITQTEGTAWLINRTLPSAVTTLIGQLPTDQQFAAMARAVAPSEVLRLDPLVVALASAQGKTAAEMDEFFITYKDM